MTDENFPYHNQWIQSPEILFKNLKSYQSQPIYRRYHLCAFYPNKNRFLLPPRFRGRSVYLHSSESDYWSIDVLSDWFIESVRIKGHKNGFLSPIEFWKTSECQQLVKNCKTPAEKRGIVYDNIYEPRQFRMTWVYGLLSLVFETKSMTGKKMLDISAGWGDRMLSAISLGMEYLGFDPNPELVNGHQGIIKKFGNPDKHQVKVEGFETSKIESEAYDVVLSSPPYFDLEVYNPNDQLQSINKYPEFECWYENFLIPSLRKSWDALKNDGYLILHLGDTRKYPMCELVYNEIFKNFPGAFWEGIIGVSGGSGRVGPVWVWQKKMKI